MLIWRFGIQFLSISILVTVLSNAGCVYELEVFNLEFKYSMIKFQFCVLDFNLFGLDFKTFDKSAHFWSSTYRLESFHIFVRSRTDFVLQIERPRKDIARLDRVRRKVNKLSQRSRSIITRTVRSSCQQDTFACECNTSFFRPVSSYPIHFFSN